MVNNKDILIKQQKIKCSECGIVLTPKEIEDFKKDGLEYTNKGKSSPLPFIIRCHKCEYNF